MAQNIKIVSRMQLKGAEQASDTDLCLRDSFRQLWSSGFSTEINMLLPLTASCSAPKLRQILLFFKVVELLTETSWRRKRRRTNPLCLKAASDDPRIKRTDVCRKL